MDCSNSGVLLPFIALGLGAVCAITSRVLLLIAAVRISAAWTIGVLLPFGPMVFRLNYPDEARRSMMFRYATLAFFTIYLFEGPSLKSLTLKHSKYVKGKPPSLRGLRPGDTLYYGTERAVSAKSDLPLPERRAANDLELTRLRTWYEGLKLLKRDLLHSDFDGNRSYTAELARYNDALAKAMVERKALDAMPGSNPSPDTVDRVAP